MENCDELTSSGRVTRSLRNRLVSIDSETSNRSVTPLPSKLTSINETNSPLRATRMTRRNSTEQATPIKTPAKSKTLQRAQTPEVGTPVRRATRRCSISEETLYVSKTTAPPVAPFDVLLEEDASTLANSSMEKRQTLSDSKSQKNKTRVKPGPKSKTRSRLHSIGLEDSDVEAANLDADERKSIEKLNKSENKSSKVTTEPISDVIDLDDTTMDEDYEKKSAELESSNTSKKSNTPIKANSPKKNNTPRKAETPEKNNTPKANTSPKERNTPMKKLAIILDADEVKLVEKLNKSENKTSKVATEPISDVIDLDDTTMDEDYDKKSAELESSKTSKKSNTPRKADSPKKNNTPKVNNTPKGCNTSMKKIAAKSPKPDAENASILKYFESLNVQKTPNIVIVKAVSLQAPFETVKYANGSKDHTPVTTPVNSPSNTPMSRSTKSVNFSHSDINDSAKSVYPKTPAQTKIKSYINMDDSKEAMEDKSFQSDKGEPVVTLQIDDSTEDFEILETPGEEEAKSKLSNVSEESPEVEGQDNAEKTPHKAKLLKNFQSSTPLVESLRAEQAEKEESNVKQMQPLSEKEQELNTNEQPSRDAADSPDKFLRSGKSYGESPKSSPKTRKSLERSKDDTVNSVESANVEPQTVEIANVELQAVESANVELQTVESANVELQAVENANVELQAVESANVELQAVESAAATGDKNLSPLTKTPAKLNESKGSSFAKSWSQGVSGKAKGDGKIDAISALEKSLDKSSPKEIEEASTETSQKRRLYSEEPMDVDEAPEEEEEQEETEHQRNDFIDDEVEEADENYQSGDSMDEDEKLEVEENEIPVDAESLGSQDTDESVDNEEDNDSFIVSDEEVSIGFSDEDEYLEEEENKSSEKKYKRIQAIASSSESENEAENALNGESKTEEASDSNVEDVSMAKMCSKIVEECITNGDMKDLNQVYEKEATNKSLNESKQSMKLNESKEKESSRRSEQQEKKQNNGEKGTSDDKSDSDSKEKPTEEKLDVSLDSSVDASKLSDSAIRLLYTGDSESDEQGTAQNEEELNASRKKLLKRLSMSERFNKTSYELEVDKHDSSSSGTIEETEQENKSPVLETSKRKSTEHKSLSKLAPVASSSNEEEGEACKKGKSLNRSEVSNESKDKNSADASSESSEELEVFTFNKSLSGGARASIDTKSLRQSSDESVDEQENSTVNKSHNKSAKGKSFVDKGKLSKRSGNTSLRQNQNASMNASITEKEVHALNTSTKRKSLSDARNKSLNSSAVDKASLRAKVASPSSDSSDDEAEDSQAYKTYNKSAKAEEVGSPSSDSSDDEAENSQTNKSRNKRARRAKAGSASSDSSDDEAEDSQANKSHNRSTKRAKVASESSDSSDDEAEDSQANKSHNKSAKREKSFAVEKRVSKKSLNASLKLKQKVSTDEDDEAEIEAQEHNRSTKRNSLNDSKKMKGEAKRSQKHQQLKEQQQEVATEAEDATSSPSKRRSLKSHDQLENTENNAEIYEEDSEVSDEDDKDSSSHEDKSSSSKADDNMLETAVTNKKAKLKRAASGLSVSFGQVKKQTAASKAIRHSSFTFDVVVSTNSNRDAEMIEKSAESNAETEITEDSSSKEATSPEESAEKMSKSFEQKNRSLNAKRKRLSQSFSFLGSLDSTDLDTRHLHKKHKDNLHSSTPHAASKKVSSSDDYVSERQRVLSRCEAILEEANRAKLEQKLNFKKNNAMLNKKKQKKDKLKLKKQKAAEKEEFCVPLVSKKQEKRKVKVKKALEQALLASANIILKEPGKKKPKLLPMIDALEATLKVEQKSDKKKSIETSISPQQENRFMTAAGEVVESLCTPPRNKKASVIRKFRLPNGIVTEEPITPKASTSRSGFRESPITPRVQGFKVRKMLVCDDQRRPFESLMPKRLSSKRKRLALELNDAIPTRSGTFLEEDASLQKNIRQLKKENGMITTNSTALNFKSSAMFRKDLPRESSHEVLQRKQRQQRHNQY